MKARPFLSGIIKLVHANGTPIHEDFRRQIATNDCLEKEVNADYIIMLLKMITPRFRVDYTERLDRQDHRRLLQQTADVLRKCIDAHQHRCGRCNRHQAITFVLGRFLNTYICYETFGYLPNIPLADKGFFRESDPDNYLDGRIDHMTSGILTYLASLQVEPEHDRRYN